MAKQTPVGQMRKLVTLLERGSADEYFYPPETTNTVLQPEFQPYYNFTQETVELPYTGAADWGQRITFSLPFPTLGDCLSWITLRFSPNSWLPGDVIEYLQTAQPNRWQFQDLSGAWMWTSHLATAAIALVEMEVNGIVIEQWSGDWIDIWQQVYLDVSRSSGYEDSISGSIDRTYNNGSLIRPTEDGNVYVYLPFWFSRKKNAAFPLVSVQGEGNVRFHITFRKFEDVIRRVVYPRRCGETMLGTQSSIINTNTPLPTIANFTIPGVIPSLKDAVLLCGFIQLDGELRKAYIQRPHEVLWTNVLNIPFSEPIKYSVNTGGEDTITVSLPLDAANGPIKEIIWFVRRKAIYKYNSWNNYGAYMEDEIDPIFKPQRPLMKKAVLRMGAVVWADQDELWWRGRGALCHPGGIQLMTSYIYAYSFGDDPVKFGPTGSVNASRTNLRLDVTVQPPVGVDDSEWEIQVYVLTYNWIRFQNGIAERLFTD